MWQPTTPPFLSEQIDLWRRVADALRTSDVTEAWQDVSAGIPEGGFKRVVTGVAEALEETSTLAGALTGFRDVFPDQVIYLVRQGELTDELPRACEQAASHLEEEKRTSRLEPPDKQAIVRAFLAELGWDVPGAEEVAEDVAEKVVQRVKQWGRSLTAFVRERAAEKPPAEAGP